MAADITQYESLRKAEFSYHGMVRRCALRNIAAMEPNGLKAARKRLKVGQAVIAERLGVSVPQVSRWENGIDNVPSARLTAFAEAYEAGLGELFGGDLPEEPSDIPEGAIPVMPIPMLGDVPAGPWQEAVRRSHHYIPAPQPGMPSSAYALKVSGNSMDRVVRDGATIIIDPEDRDLFDRWFYVVRNDEYEVTFKQYRENPARLVPCSTDPSHTTIPITDRDFEIVGRVIKIILDPSQAALD